MNGLRVFHRVAASRGAPGKGSGVYAGGAVRNRRCLSGHHSGQDCALIVMRLSPHAPESPIAWLSAFCFYFKGLQRFPKLAISYVGEQGVWIFLRHGTRGISPAIVWRHTDADILGRMPRERTVRCLVILHLVWARAEETGPWHGATLSPVPGVRRAPSHMPAVPRWCQTGRYSAAVPQRGVLFRAHTAEAGYSDRR
jgi:hypothetical protein